MSGLKLRSRFMLGAALLVVGLTTAMSAAVLTQVRRSLSQEARQRGASLCDQLGAMARFPLRAGDGRELSRLARQGLASPDVAAVEFQDRSGRSLAREENPGPAERSFSLSCQVMGGPEFADQLELLQGSASAPGEPAGEVRLTMSYAAVDRIVKDLAWAIAVWALILAAAAMVAGAWLARRISRPIEELAAVADAVGAGRLDVEVPADQGGEIGRLAERFNQMARDLKLSVASMLQQEKMATLGQLASGVSHEIGSPLNSILMDAQHLSEHAPDPQSREIARAILQQTRRISETIRNLLDYARRPPERMEQVELAQALEEALLVLAHPVRKSGVTIARDLPPDLPPVRAIKNLCVQVLVNLLRNALESAGPGGEVRVSADREGTRSTLSITDSGPGFRTEDLERAFEPFFTTKSLGEGTGLGLAICQTIMKSCGGDIRIEKHQEKWARVTLEFMVAEKSKGAQ